jgi:hypothetical protein
VRSNDGSKGTQLKGSADPGFLAAAEELRRLQMPIPSKADAIREAVREALKRAEGEDQMKMKKPPRLVPSRIIHIQYSQDYLDEIAQKIDEERRTGQK